MSENLSFSQRPPVCEEYSADPIGQPKARKSSLVSLLLLFLVSCSVGNFNRSLNEDWLIIINIRYKEIKITEKSKHLCHSKEISKINLVQGWCYR